MAHRRVKDVAYDEDDFDDYEEEDYGAGDSGMTAEDQVKMRESTVLVRQALGDSSTVPTKEIEEALWYYFYDIDKTVAYLTKQNTPQQPKQQKQKAPTKFEQAASAAQSKATAAGYGLAIPPQPYPSIHELEPQSRSRKLSAAEFFADTPWLEVPPERLSNILVQPMHPRGGLLGGSSSGAKPQSKLAQLAAARKKAAEEKKAAEQGTVNGLGPAAQDETAGSNALLDRLSSLKRPAPAGSEGQPATKTLPIRTYPKREKPTEPEPAPEPKQEAGPEKPVEPEKPRGPTAKELTAAPSVFARTMLGAFADPPAHRRPSQATTEDISLFTLPYPGVSDQTNDPFAGPSPDDVVIKAQSKGAQNKNSAAKAAKASVKGDAATKDVTQGVGAIQLEQPQPTTKVKSKNLNVLEEFKKSNAKNAANFVVIGHVDHGKSTLMGRLLYDLKLVTDRSFSKLSKDSASIGKSSFALAWIMDSTEEERARGVTVDIALNNFETSKTRFTILDAPGHRDFIPNMIAGAAQADFAVLVVDASTNAFEAGFGARGQTREHALLVRSMGIARVIVAVNKMDQAGWSQGRFEEVKGQMEGFLVGAGFKQESLSFVPCAGLTGENVANKLKEGTAPWYSGGTLVEELDASEPTARAIEKPLRMTISDVFRGGVTNPLSIAGRLDAGNIQVGDTILAMPSHETATVKAIEVDNEPSDYCVSGQIATLHLADIDPVHLRLGDIICSPSSSPIQNIRAFTAKILAFEHVTPGWVDVHRGRLHTPAKVAQLLAALGKTGEVEKKRPRVVKPGAVARVRVELDKALPLDKGARVVLRGEGVTLAAGLVEGVEV